MGLTGSKNVQPEASNFNPYPYGDPRTALLDGAETDDHEKVATVLRLGVRRDVKRQEQPGRTALMLAAGNGHLGCVDELISCKASLDQGTSASGHLGGRKGFRRWIGGKPFEQGYTAAMFAALGGHSECLESILRAQAQVDATCIPSEKTALLIAAEEGHQACVETLIMYGADMNAQTTEGFNAISLAASKGHAGCVEYLLEAGARPDSRGLNAAAEGGNVDCLKLLMNQRLEINPQIRNGVMTPLMTAAKLGHLECLRELIAAGADVHVFSRTVLDNLFHPSAIMLAAYNGHVKCIGELAQAGVDVNLAPIEKEHQTPLMAAVMGKQYTAVTKLVELGADIRLKSVKYVMIEAALWKKDAQMVRLLCDLGVRLSKKYHDWFITYARGMRGGRLTDELREIAELLRTIESEQANSSKGRSRSSRRERSRRTNNHRSSRRGASRPSAPSGSPPRQKVRPSAPPPSSSESPPPTYEEAQAQYYPDLVRGQASASLQKALADQQRDRSNGPNA